MLTREQRKEKLQTVFRVASGNFLEMYDFMIFGYFSAAIGRAYFPASSEFASLMFSMTTFAVGFMVRPLGAIFLGAYIDHIGRRKGLLLTLALMSVGTLTIGVVPGYETIGLFAPIVVVLGRLCQGFSAEGVRGTQTPSDALRNLRQHADPLADRDHRVRGCRRLRRLPS